MGQVEREKGNGNWVEKGGGRLKGVTGEESYPVDFRSRGERRVRLPKPDTSSARKGMGVGLRKGGRTARHV